MNSALDDRCKGLPVERIKRSVLDRLPEYSLTLPTGVEPGKVWKRNINMGSIGKPSPREKEPPVWVVGEYVTASPGQCRTEWRALEIVEEA